MLIEIARFCLVLALCVTIVQVVIPLVGIRRQQLTMMQVAQSGAILQFALVVFAFVSLTTLILIRFNSYPQRISHLADLWIGLNSSGLLWLLVLTLWMALFCHFSKRLPYELRAATLSVLAILLVGFYALVLAGFNLLAYSLFSPSLAITHINPPMYLGYSGFSIVFAFSVATLIKGRLDAVWLRYMRLWVMLAWCLLTAGILWDSWRLPYKQSWGALNWLQDVSLAPWLLGIALLHALLLSEKRGVLKAWTTLLSIVVFSVSLVSMFIRYSPSSVLEHHRLIWLLCIIIVSLLLFAVRGRRFISQSRYSVFSREMVLLLNTVCLCFFVAAAMLLKTTEHLYAVCNPIVLIFLFLLGIGPYFKWQHNAIRGLFIRATASAIFVCVISIMTLKLLGLSFKAWAAVGLALGLWILWHTLNHWVCWQKSRGVVFQRLSRSQWAMVLAHAGVAVSLIGGNFSYQYSSWQQNFFIRCIWFGGLMMMLSGIFVIIDRRYRVKSQGVGA